jgi:Reverse transcriptase-like
MDSRLVVEQMLGHWKIKDLRLAELAGQAKHYASVFSSVVYVWIPRGQNNEADSLANDAIDQRPRMRDTLTTIESALRTEISKLIGTYYEYVPITTRDNAAMAAIREIQSDPRVIQEGNRQ